MTEQPPGPPWGGYPPQPPGSYPPPSPSGYPPPSPSGYPPPGYPPPGYPPQASSGYIQLPGGGAVQVASIGQRFLARLIDSVLIGVVYLVVELVGISDMVSTAHPVTDQYGHTTYQPSAAGMAGYFLMVAILGCVAFLYEWLMIGLRGATLGKMALSIKVVNEGTGELLGLGGAAMRYLIFFVGGLACGIGTIVVWLSVLFDDSGRLQGWQDKAAHDLVIRQPR